MTSYIHQGSRPIGLHEQLLRLAPDVSLLALILLAIQVSVVDLPMWKRVIIVMASIVALWVTIVAGPGLLIRE
jgi:hypothetical protein